MNIKLFLVAILLLAALLYWGLPKTMFVKKLKMNVGLFYAMNIIGIVFGALGLIVSFIWPNVVLEKHYFELILLPILFVYLYTAMIRKVRGAIEMYDEKQNLNMTQAAAITWPISIVAVFFLYAMYREEILTGLAFFPIFLYFSFAVYSASTLYFFKKN
ncbi:MAG: hypothetical protein ACE5HO_21510 [bacterium]